MTLRDFNGLSEFGKNEVVELWGNLLTEKVIRGHEVKVYEINNFYVEVYFDALQRKIKKYRTCTRKETVCEI